MLKANKLVVNSVNAWSVTDLVSLQSWEMDPILYFVFTLLYFFILHLLFDHVKYMF